MKRGMYMKWRAGDFFVVAAVLLLAVSIWLIPNLTQNEGETLRITRDGKLIYTASLSEDRVIEFPEITVEISGEAARVVRADCPDKVCEKSGEISRAGEIVICVPNRMSIEIDGNASFDAIAG